MRAAFSCASVGLSLLALGMPAMPGRIPGDRIVTNLTERLKKDPQNPAIYYLIGRAHYATYSRAVENSWVKKGEVEVFQRGDSLPAFFSIEGNIYPWDNKTAVKNTSDNRRHISEAIRTLRISLDIPKQKGHASSDFDPALAHLTLGCTFESGALLASKVPLLRPYQKLTTSAQWRSMAADEYLLAFQGSITADRKVTEKPLWGLQTLVAFEAGQSYVRLRPKTTQARAVKTEVDRLLRLPPPSTITPLVLCLEEAKPLSALLEPDHTVHFNLDGTGRPQASAWVKPTTAFLVWDPSHEGKITSGRQLFGNATWWMLWPNAYAALDALDDNRDGWLSGPELSGLALWYDSNGNGKCDPGEVIPLEKTQIISLRTSFDAHEGLSLVSSQGVKLKDGRVLPTYDWVTKSIVDAQPSTK